MLVHLCHCGFLFFTVVVVFCLSCESITLFQVAVCSWSAHSHRNIIKMSSNAQISKQKKPLGECVEERNRVKERMIIRKMNSRERNSKYTGSRKVKDRKKEKKRLSNDGGSDTSTRTEDPKKQQRIFRLEIEIPSTDGRIKQCEPSSKGGSYE